MVPVVAPGHMFMILPGVPETSLFGKNATFMQRSRLI
jgi:hypothetical protein